MSSFAPKHLTAGFAAAMAIYLGLALFSYRSTTESVADARRVARSHHLLEELRNLNSDVAEAETGQRGYVITGDGAYLATVDESAASAERDLERLRRLAPGAEARREIDALEPVVREKLGLIQRTVALRREEGMEAA